MNIIFDGNYLCHSRYAVIHNYLEGQEGRVLSKTEALSEKENQARFFRKLITDFSNVVRNFEDIERVVLVFDKNSWRKQLYPQYKDKSPKDEVGKLLQEENKIGNEIFQKVLEKFAKHMESKGFIVIAHEGMEGDDLCYFCSDYLSSLGEECIIISGDKDLLQVMNKNVAVYRNNSMAPAFFYYDSNSMLKIGNKIKETVKKLKIEEVNPTTHIYKKILIGDSGDKVPNLFKGLGEKTADKIIESLDSNSMLNLDLTDFQQLNNICGAIKNTVKNSPPEEELIMSVLMNVQLMWLNKTVYPDQTELEDIIEKTKQKLQTYSFDGEFTLDYILNKN